MDQKAIENWQKVKTALEAAGKTDSPFYHRAVAVVKTGKDPGEQLQKQLFWGSFTQYETIG